MTCIHSKIKAHELSYRNKSKLRHALLPVYFCAFNITFVNSWAPPRALANCTHMYSNVFSSKQSERCVCKWGNTEHACIFQITCIKLLDVAQTCLHLLSHSHNCRAVINKCQESNLSQCKSWILWVMFLFTLCALAALCNKTKG